MNAEIITIGDELLIGQTIDTNSAWIGKKLSEHGIAVSRRTAVSDKRAEIVAAIEEALKRVTLVLVTGGLGPTKDDITKKTLADFYGCGYRTDQAVVSHLEQLFAARGRTLMEVNRMQADVPECCETLFNAVGTAPGMWFDRDGRVLISMPGVPNEMMHIMEHEVFPRLKNRFKTPVIRHLNALTVNIAESLLSRELEEIEAKMPEHLSLAYLPSMNTVKLRLTGSAEDESALEDEMQHWYDQICDKAGSYLFAREDTTASRYIARKLMEKKIRFTLAESCTGGYIANQLVLEPGISDIFKGSIISYSNEVKARELGVPEETFTTVGAVSEICARYMAEGALKKFGADVAISTTGIAGPTGATNEKPVGLIYIGVATRTGTEVQSFKLFGNREQFMMRACNVAMLMVKKALQL